MKAGIAKQQQEERLFPGSTPGLAIPLYRGRKK